jgi:hypothetical protein
MNRKQREKNRRTYSELMQYLRKLEASKSICPECGVKGEYHWVQTGFTTLEHMITGLPPSGFWICSKFYDSVTGRRI